MTGPLKWLANHFKFSTFLLEMKYTAHTLTLLHVQHEQWISELKRYLISPVRQTTRIMKITKIKWRSLKIQCRLSVMSKQKLTMTRKAGLSPANKLPLITYKRGASQKIVCIKKKTWKRRKSITQVTAAVSMDPSGISTSLSLVILYAAFHSAQKMSIGKCLRGLWWKFFHSFCIDRMPNQYLLPTNKLLLVSVENIVENAGRRGNKQLSGYEENMNWLETGPELKVTETHELLRCPYQVLTLKAHTKNLFLLRGMREWILYTLPRIQTDSII